MLKSSSASIQTIMVRAGSDRSFRELMLDDPVQALLESGVSLTDEITIVPVNSSPDTNYIVIPTPPGNEEVTDEDLAQVTGGATPLISISVLVGLPLGAIPVVTVVTLIQET